MSIGISLTLAALLATGADARPVDDRALVARLGSARYLDREAAEAALLRRGPLALTPLRAAARDRDPEVRSRAAAILRRIERDGLLRATPVDLGRAIATLDEALDRLASPSGAGFIVDVPDGDARRSLPVATVAPETLPFWAALDRVCDAAGLRPDLGRPGPEIVLCDGHGRAAGCRSDDGPFRFQVTGLAYQSEIDLNAPMASPGDGSPRAARRLYVRMILAAEPRLSITPTGPARVIEAIDERGRSLAPAAEPDSSTRASAYFGINPASTARVQVDLDRPDDPGRRIARLRGSIPIVVSARRSDPLVVPLDPSRRPGASDPFLVVRSDPARGDAPASIELSAQVGRDSPPRADSLTRAIEVVGAGGQVLPWFPSATRFEDDTIRLTISLGATDPRPAAIRHHEIMEATADVTFDFRDLPMP